MSLWPIPTSTSPTKHVVLLNRTERAVNAHGPTPLPLPCLVAETRHIANRPPIHCIVPTLRGQAAVRVPIATKTTVR